MMPLVAAAVGIASKFIPELIGSALDSKKAEKVADIVTKHAVAAFPGVVEPLKEFSDLLDKSPEQVDKLRAEIMELRLDDVKHAREHQVKDDKLTYLIVISSYVGTGLLVLLLAYMATLDLDVLVITPIATLIGGAITWLQQQVQQITNFKYGSSIGSKLKDK
jgi:hypothetical protein